MDTPPEVCAITLGVRDVELSRRFYVEGLGFRSVLDVPGEISFVQCAPGQVLALWDVREMPSEYGDTSACVADPDGFRWDFVHNSNFVVDPDGTVRMGG